MTTVTERIFARKLEHSEPDRQECIQQTARRIEHDIRAAMVKDKAELHEIAGCVLGFMDTETMAFLIMSAKAGDLSSANAARLMLVNEIDAAITRTAECRAIKHVESVTPDEFKH